MGRSHLTTWVLALGLAAVPASLTWHGSRALAAPADSPADPARVDRGAYLVRIMGCNHCHTPYKVGPHGPEPDMTRALTGPEVFSFDQGATTSDMFAVLGTLSAALQDPLADHTAAGQAAMAGIDAGLEKVTTAQTIVGSRMGWIEIIDQRRVANGELVADERKAIGGADLATTMTRLQEVLTVLEASQASFVRLANLSLFDQLR